MNAWSVKSACVFDLSGTEEMHEREKHVRLWKEERTVSLRTFLEIEKDRDVNKETEKR